MNVNHTMRTLGISLLLITLAGTAAAFPRFARLTKKNCAACHSNVAGGAELGPQLVGPHRDPRHLLHRPQQRVGLL